ncbi:hypothetical protein [Pyrolobus fumarii]|nr:hypothetical protein [Pyrolobus fumarii]
MSVSNPEDTLRNIVRSKIVFRALRHVVKRVESFNSGRFPVAIELVGLGGSALLAEDVGDIDVVLGCSVKREYVAEWKSFKRLLHEKLGELWLIITEVSSRRGRATIDAIISEYYDRLRELGFKDWWIREWFRWLRV